MAYLYILAGGITLFIIIKGIMSRSDPTKAYMYKPVTFLDLKKQVRFDVEPDYMNPNQEIKHDENTQQPYVLRKKSFMDKGPDKLTLHDYYVLDSPGFRLIVNNVGVINEFVTKKMLDQSRTIMDLQNQRAILKFRVVELETKLQEEFNIQIETHKKMKDAAALVYSPKK